MMFQVTGFKSDGTIDFNFRIPERIGSWWAFTRTVNPLDNFSSTIREIDIVSIDSIENF